MFELRALRSDLDDDPRKFLRPPPPSAQCIDAAAASAPAAFARSHTQFNSSDESSLKAFTAITTGTP